MTLFSAAQEDKKVKLPIKPAHVH